MFSLSSRYNGAVNGIIVIFSSMVVRDVWRLYSEDVVSTFLTIGESVVGDMVPIFLCGVLAAELL